MSNETKRVPVAQWKQITSLLDKIRYAGDAESEQEYVMQLLDLFDADSAELKAPAPNDELARLEHILSGWFCDDTLENWQLRGVLTSSTKWFDVSEYPSGLRVKTLRWLEIQGRIERHPTDPNLVRLREKE